MNNRPNYSRREFLTTALAGASILTAAPVLTAADAAPKTPGACNGNDIVTLGKTGIKASRLAQGTGYNGSARSSDHTRMGKAAFDRLVRHSLDQGINFMDMADLYGSHPFVRDVLKGIPRDKYVLLSKIWVRKEDWVTPSGGAAAEVNRFCQELGTDTLDLCLIHCASDDKWMDNYARVRDGLSEMKQKGRVRAVGVSCHDLGALKLAASQPWTDAIFARINHKGGKDYSMDGTADEVAEVLQLARRNGKAVIGMKIFGAGRLVQPEEKDASLKFVFGRQLVDAITVGMKTVEQVDDTLERMSRVKAA